MPIILLVEDDVLLQKFAKDVLHDAGYDLTLSPSGEEALALFRAGVVNYRALVSDINLQGAMDGWELAKHVREINPTFPVIYMTGAAAAQWASHGVPESVLLPKPFAPAQLVTAVSQLLNVTAPAAINPPAGSEE